MASVNLPTPALVPHRAAQALPRWALWLLCAAYVLPGVIGRDPWRNADLTAYAYMLAMAEGRTSWLAPMLGGLPADGALLPHWLGAVFIQALGSWIDPALAARLPFALLLLATLAGVWYATFHLARTEAAQPVRFAFGGEAHPVDYARALADGALLALVACLGLLQLGHETTPELVQLSEVAALLWALAAAPFRTHIAGWVAGLAVVALALSGAPSLALALGTAGGLVWAFSNYPQVRRLSPWLLLALAVAAGLATWADAWRWRLDGPRSLTGLWAMGRTLVWFTWPTWPLVLWTLWRWRHHWHHRHISIPLSMVTVCGGAFVLMNGYDRVLMLALPGLAVLAAFALPTLQRSAGAAIDWFSVFFFSLAALAVWVIYASMHSGVPAQPLVNILRLAPGFEVRFQAMELLFAGLGTLAWLALVRWRTARHRHPLWKTLVLPASGVTLSWLLTMTLLLPVLDYARSPRPLITALARHVPRGSCVVLQGGSRPSIAALEALGGYRVQPLGRHGIRRSDALAGGQGCNHWLIESRTSAAEPNGAPEGWVLLARVRRPTDRHTQTWVYQRPSAS